MNTVLAVGIVSIFFTSMNIKNIAQFKSDSDTLIDDDASVIKPSYIFSHRQSSLKKEKNVKLLAKQVILYVE